MSHWPTSGAMTRRVERLERHGRRDDRELEDTMKMTSRFVMVVVLGLAAAYGQKANLSAVPTASIVGTVVDDQGKALDKAFVTYQREPWNQGQLGQYSQGVFTKADGSFKFAPLFEGSYRFCVQTAIQRGYVSPCAWTRNAPLAKVADGQAMSGLKLVAERGQTVEIRVKDVKGLLGAKEGGGSSPVVFQPYLKSTGLNMSHYASFQGRELTEHVYRVVVPHGVSVVPMVHASGLTVQDEVGKAVGLNQGTHPEFVGDRGGPVKVIGLVVNK